MRTSAFEECPLDGIAVHPGERDGSQVGNLELGCVRELFRDRQGIEHLHIYAPLKDVPENLWEVFPPEDEGMPLELLSPEHSEQS